MLQTEAVAGEFGHVHVLEIDDLARRDLAEHIALLQLVGAPDVGLLEGEPRLVGMRKYEDVHIERERREDGGSDKERLHETREAHPATECRDHLAAAREFAGEQQHRDEDQQSAEEVAVVDHEVEIVVHHDLVHAGRGLREILRLLADVEHHGDGHDEDQDEEERPQELPDDIAVEGFEHVLQRSGVKGLPRRHRDTENTFSGCWW